jgi:energy-coupling factor transporter ATP-binding protein EcfA2
MDGLTFKRLQLKGWRQFATVDIDFHERLTVLTGANGAGKSTLLNILSRHVGSERPLHGVPKKGRDGVITHLSGRLATLGWWTRLFGPWQWKDNQVGEIEYSSGAVAALSVPASVSAVYSLQVPNQQQVFGITIGSHGLLAPYQQVPYIPFQGVPPDQAFGMFHNEAAQRYLGQSQNHSSLIFQLKQALAAWAAIGEGNSILQANAAQRDAYRGFVLMLRKLLPPSLGFMDIDIRPPDILLVTKSGEFLIDAASGGLTTLIEIGALIYACTLRPETKDKRFVVVYDEPENHLHPQLQRTLFQRLVDTFPNAQFVVATHSPFIVSSLKESNVYVLRYENTGDEEPTEQSRIVSQKLDYVNRAGNASEILREALGLPNTLPLWVEDDLQRIVRTYEGRELTPATLDELKESLRSAGLGELFPEALVGLARTR